MKLNLTEDVVKRLKPAAPGTRYEVFDKALPGLLIRVSTSPLGKTTKTFMLRARFPGNADLTKRAPTTDPARLNPTRRAIGWAGRVTVDQARTTARRWFELISQRQDPRQVEHAEIEAREAEARRQVLFGTVLEDWIGKRVSTFRRAAKVAREARMMLKPLVNRPIGTINRGDCASLIADIATRSPSQARAALRSLKTCFNWAIESGRYQLEVSPCDRIKFSKLVGVLPHRQRVLTDSELRVFWMAAQNLSDFERDYFVLLALTAQRRGEVAGIRKREIDWQRKLWTIPEARYKTGQFQIVPLSDELLKLLQARPCGTGENDCLLSADDSGKTPMRGFHNATVRLRREMKKIDPEIAIDWETHDLRRTARTRLSSLGVQDTAAEYILGHRPRGIAAIYNQHRYESECRAALDKWQRYLHRIVERKPVRVVSIHG